MMSKRQNCGPLPCLSIIWKDYTLRMCCTDQPNRDDLWSHAASSIKSKMFSRQWLDVFVGLLSTRTPPCHGRCIRDLFYLRFTFCDRAAVRNRWKSAWGWFSCVHLWVGDPPKKESPPLIYLIHFLRTSFRLSHLLFLCWSLVSLVCSASSI